MITTMIKKKIKQKVIGFLLQLIKPFIVPIIIVVAVLILVCSITDILYIGYNNEEKIDIKKEMKYYYSERKYEKEEMKTFFSSVWDFVDKMIGGSEMPEKTDWPVERSI